MYSTMVTSLLFLLLEKNKNSSVRVLPNERLEGAHESLLWPLSQPEERRCTLGLGLFPVPQGAETTVLLLDC